MDAFLTSEASPRPAKRQLDDGASNHETPRSSLGKSANDASKDNSQTSSLPSPPISGSAEKRDRENAQLVDHTREPSPAGSAVSSSLSDPKSATPGMSGSNARGSDQQPPRKRTKLTFAEKEEKKALKEIEDRKKAEARATKEAEKREKEAEKAKRDAEKEAERKKKEAEKEEKRLAKEAKDAAKEKERLVKEEEKRKKEEEKKKKDANQMRLNSFFKKPSAPKDNAAAVADVEKGVTPNTLKSMSQVEDKPSGKKAEVSDYDKIFPPFFVQSNVTVAPYSRFARDERGLESLQSKLDQYITQQAQLPKPKSWDASELFHIPEYALLQRRGKPVVPVRHIMNQLEGLGNHARPVDLTSQSTQIQRRRNLLKSVRLKYLKYYEDVRPPYSGTYSKTPSSGIARLARNPFKRDLPDTNYDYDSEAEWEEPEEGEDLGSEGEDEEEPEDGEDLDGFLDDENDEVMQSRLAIPKELEPVSTGLCFEDRKRRNPTLKLYAYRMEVIHEKLNGRAPIDPFATHYWETPTPCSTAGAMDPPRLPLQSVRNNATPPSSLNPTNPNAPASNCGPQGQSNNKSGAPKKLIVDEDMEAFKQAIQGSDLTKQGLVEVLYKRFQKRNPRAAVKDTLNLVAKRVGNKQADKRWVLI